MTDFTISIGFYKLNPPRTELLEQALNNNLRRKENINGGFLKDIYVVLLYVPLPLNERVIEAYEYKCVYILS